MGKERNTARRVKGNGNVKEKNRDRERAKGKKHKTKAESLGKWGQVLSGHVRNDWNPRSRDLNYEGGRQ